MFKQSLMGAMLLAASTSAALADDTDLLTGVWRMTALEVTLPSGDTINVPYQGYVIFTEEGTMSAQSMNPDPEAPDTPYSNHGYEAYIGDYALGEDGIFSVTFAQSAARGLIGQTFERVYEVSDDRLTLAPNNDLEGWKAIYERY